MPGVVNKFIEINLRDCMLKIDFFTPKKRSEELTQLRSCSLRGDQAGQAQHLAEKLALSFVVQLQEKDSTQRAKFFTLYFGIVSNLQKSYYIVPITFLYCTRYHYF